MQQDVAATTRAWRIEPTAQRVEWLGSILAHQPADTIYAMSRAIIEETGDPGYLEMVRRVVESGVAIHLIAGERSAKAWDVPDFVRAAARSYTEIAGAGHLMMLEEPDALATWQLHRDPRTLADGSIPATRIGDHRKAYLTYEGPVNGNRGTVHIVDRGTYTLVRRDEHCIEARFAGRHLSGDLTLRRDPVDERRWALDVTGDVRSTSE